MANENKDIIRVEDTEANLPTTLIAGQLGFTTDTNKMGHLMLNGIDMQWFTSTDDSWIYWSSVGWGGVTTDSPDGKFHIWTGSAGSVSADTNMNELVLENDGDCGATFLAPDSYDTTLCFGSPSDNQGAFINWNHDDGELILNAKIAGSEMKLYTADTLAATIDTSQDITAEGSIIIKDNEKVFFGTGSDSSITYDGSNMYFNSQDVGSGGFVFENGNVRIDDGKLSIQTTNTGYDLNIEGNVGLTDGSNSITMDPAFGSISATYSDFATLFLQTNNCNGLIQAWGNTDFRVGSTSNHPVAIYVNNSEAFKIDTSNDVHTYGNIYHSADSHKNYFGAGDDCSITYDGSDMVFDSQEVGSGDFIFNNGNMGVCTSSTGYALEVNADIVAKGGTGTSAGNYLGLFKDTGSLPGYASDSFPTIKTDYTAIYFSCNNKFSGYMGDNSGDALLSLNDTSATSKVLLNTNGDSYFNGGNVAIGNLTASLPIATDASKNLVSVAKSSAYTPTNVSTDRAFDADTVAIAELADVVGTLIADLQTANILG